MTDTIFSGSLPGANRASIEEALVAVVGPKLIRGRDRVFGDEVNYEDENVEIYIHATDSKEYLVNGEHLGGVDGVRDFLQKFVSALAEKGVASNFDYWEEDADGEVVGEMYTLGGKPAS